MTSLLAAALLLAQPPTLPVYLDLGGAPPALEVRVGERLRAALAERGVTVVTLPASPGSPEPALAEASRELERGVKAYRELDLATAVDALRAAEQKAESVLGSPAVAAIVSEARIHLGLIAHARGDEREAAEHFRRVATLDPDRRLDGRLHPPEVVAAYEAARTRVAKGPACELTLAAKPAAARITVNGKPASGTVRLPLGVHFVQASTELGSSGERVELTQPRAIVSLTVAPQPSLVLATLRAAAKRGDDAASGAAADALAGLTDARRVIFWDLRQQGGRVEVPMRLRDPVASRFTWQVVADVGTAAAPDVPLRRALDELLAEAPVVAAPTPAPAPGARSRNDRKGLPPWVWWAAGGVALAAAGGAAAVTLGATRQSKDDEVVVVVDK